MATCDVCTLPQSRYQGDGIGSCDCPRCDQCGQSVHSQFCDCDTDHDEYCGCWTCQDEP